MDNEDFRNAVAQLVAEGGWSSIKELVDLVSISKLKKEYDFLIEDKEDE
jgi:hypothetical protein